MTPIRQTNWQLFLKDNNLVNPRLISWINEDQSLIKRLSKKYGEISLELISEKICNHHDEQISDIELEGKMAYVQSLRDYLLGRDIQVNGRTIVDDQGAMILADHAVIKSDDGAMLATEVRAQWGVN